MAATPPPDLFTVDDLTTRYALADNAIYQWIGDGELVAFKLGRRWYIHPDDWQAFIDRRRSGFADLEIAQ